ncbi:MAG: Pantoate kinase [Promethearchaeota archaeon]|nr:MAG: Pantoate kinase [Candidatus Lokiarchaeota archaeon]
MIRKKKVTIEIPHRLTGFFEIVDMINGQRIQNPELIGSRGAGLSLSAMGRTTIALQRESGLDESVCTIFINGVQLDERAETTSYIFNYLKPQINPPLKVQIRHNFELPVGCGYGASGSGALGAVYGLNKALKLELSSFECGRIAHIAEVINKTGLGTICGLLGSGLCVLKEGGYPCVYEKIPVPPNLKVICTTFGDIHTKSVLSDRELNLKIKQIGADVLQKFIKNPHIGTFLKYSIEFTEKTEILDILNLNTTKELINELNSQKIIGASMNQLGRSVFAVCKQKQVAKIVKIFKTYQSDNNIHILQIYENGALLSA